MIFQDQLLKPEDFVLYRSCEQGGLDLTHAESKARALLIRSFLETAVNPTFTRNTYHEALYKWHVEDDRSIINPGIPPYYDQTFFNMIRNVKHEGLLRISTMTTSMWYRVILESTVTHRAGQGTANELIPCRVEEKYPDKDWDRAWSYLVLPGLPSDLTSFLWLMIHNLLPTKERLFRLGMPNINENTCDFCDRQAIDSIQHALLQCPSNDTTNSFLLEAIRRELPDVQPEQVVLLDLHLQPE